MSDDYVWYMSSLSLMMVPFFYWSRCNSAGFTFIEPPAGGAKGPLPPPPPPLPLPPVGLLWWFASSVHVLSGGPHACAHQLSAPRPGVLHSSTGERGPRAGTDIAPKRVLLYACCCCCCCETSRCVENTTAGESHCSFGGTETRATTCGGTRCTLPTIIPAPAPHAPSRAVGPRCHV